jgi:hypothetical protein
MRRNLRVYVHHEDVTPILFAVAVIAFALGFIVGCLL